MFHPFWRPSTVPIVIALIAVSAAATNVVRADSPEDRSRVEVILDQQSGTIRFMIDGQEKARIDTVGLHTEGDLSYEGMLTDTGSTQPAP